MGEFSGKVVLITGGNKGIGKGIALEFARRGAGVAIGCNSNPEMAKDTLNELQELTDACVIQSDVGTPEGCECLVEQTVRRFDRIDILINNAALQTQHSLLESSLEILKRIININLRAALLMMQHTHKYLTQSAAGRIVLVSSVHGKRPTDFDAAYSVSKGGMEMLLREAAIEFAKDGITVNAIAPGAVTVEGKTGNPRKIIMKNIETSRTFNRYLMGRYGLPQDVAELACFLVGEKASQITGATYRLDGGAMLL